MAEPGRKAGYIHQSLVLIHLHGGTRAAVEAESLIERGRKVSVNIFPALAELGLAGLIGHMSDIGSLEIPDEYKHLGAYNVLFNDPNFFVLPDF
ncbi:MAG: hypothetical protein Q7R95_02585 [bacterium]|nr:hypothetical protein [bacterium]